MSWLILISGYLIGSIPTAYIAGRLLNGGNIRRMGDGNVGAGNAYNVLGHGAGISVFFIDVAKGLLVILIARSAGLSLVVVLTAGAMVVIGHNWPVFLGFRGGRGESTTIGVLLVLVTQPMLIVAVPALTALAVKRNVILTSVLLFVPLPLVCWWMGFSAQLIIYSIGLPCLVGFTHFIRTRQVAVRRV